MSESEQQAFMEMEHGELLATAAFFSSDYTQSGRELLEEVARSRGIAEPEILRHRAACWPGVQMYIHCGSCGADMMLSKEVFIDGNYICPICDFENPVDYLEIERPSSSLGCLTSVLTFGSIFGAVRGANKYRGKRVEMIDGSFWKQLKENGASLM